MRSRAPPHLPQAQGAGSTIRLDRQIFRQLARSARRPLVLFFRRFGRGDLGFGFFGALRLFQILDRQFELFDQLLAALGGLSELFAPGLGQQQLQALDLQPDDLGFALRRDPFRLFLRQQFALREDHRVGAGEVGRKRIGGVFHAPIEPYSAAENRPKRAA